MEKMKVMRRNGCFSIDCKNRDCNSCGGKKSFPKLIGGRSKDMYRRLQRRQDSTLGRLLLAFYNNRRDQQPIMEEV